MQRVITFWLIENVHVCICWINVCQIQIVISMWTQNQEYSRTNKQIKKKEEKKWNATELKIVSEYDQEIPQSQTADNPVAYQTHIFWVKSTASYPLGYWGIVIFSFIKSNCATILSSYLQRFPKMERKVIEYSYVSGQCRQIINDVTYTFVPTNKSKHNCHTFLHC